MYTCSIMPQTHITGVQKIKSVCGNVVLFQPSMNTVRWNIMGSISWIPGRALHQGLASIVQSNKTKSTSTDHDLNFPIIYGYLNSTIHTYPMGRVDTIFTCSCVMFPCPGQQDKGQCRKIQGVRVALSVLFQPSMDTVKWCVIWLVSVVTRVSGLRVSVVTLFYFSPPWTQ